MRQASATKEEMLRNQQENEQFALDIGEIHRWKGWKGRKKVSPRTSRPTRGERNPTERYRNIIRMREEQGSEIKKERET